AGLPGKSQCLIRLEQIRATSRVFVPHFAMLEQTCDILPDILECSFRLWRVWPDLKQFVRTSSMSEEKLKILDNMIPVYRQRSRFRSAFTMSGQTLRCLCGVHCMLDGIFEFRPALLQCFADFEISGQTIPFAA